MDIEKLCKLSSIDINISKKITKEEILRDVNIILNCAKALDNININDNDNINNNEKVMTLSSLRDDVPVLQDKESILLNSKEQYKNFFVVPKRAKQEIEE
jgi:aspartyl/glutamyl-tRNA(Asn/Gln) amidotransferase C subunit